jgi:hypothetical protein
MKRNRFGINVDEGVALTNPDDFEQFFVETDSITKKKLLEWLKSGNQSVLFGGQIGCGKTTLIEYAFHESHIKPDIVFHFDSGSLNLSAIDSWSIVFAGLFNHIASLNLIGMDEIPVEYVDILGETSEVWHESLSQIRLESFSQATIEKNKAFNRLLELNQEHLPNFFTSLIKKIGSQKNDPLIFFASGVDKFEPGSSAYFELNDIFQILSAHKTLFEVNAVHIFSGDSWMRKMDKIVISASETGQIEKMLEKRLGRYAKTYAKEIPLIAAYSGGIPRQALRLLDSFLAVQKQMLNNYKAFFQAVENVNRDFFAFSQRPENALMQNVKKNQFLETDLISLSGDKETAKRAVFGNWLILKEHLQESRWKSFVNPVIKSSFVEIEPEEPEIALFKEYAKQTGISNFGLDANIDQIGWHETLLDQLETSIELNVTQILDSISSALLSTQRADRIIVAYKDKGIADAVRAYLEAKSNTYEYQVWSHYLLEDGQETSPLIKMIQLFPNQLVDVFSFDFSGDFSKKTLDELNLRRDSFIDKQLIWWIPKEKLSTYLGRWTQLRQLFQVYVLEEDLTKALSIDEIESDLDFMSELAESEGTASFSYVKNLKIVLDYLKEVNNG